MSHVKRILLLNFPEQEAAELCIQLGRVSPETPVKTHKLRAEQLDVSPDTLIFLMDSPVAIGQTLDLFQSTPMPNMPPN